VLAPGGRNNESVELRITPAFQGERTKMQHCDKSVIHLCTKLSHSVRDERFEHRADVLANNKIGKLVEFGRLAIDDDEARAVPLCH
jgi:hypothetical protein